ncbi:hypothetical protein BH24PSE2_BH24PSE2_23790 [soil metagenome]
MKLWFVLTFTIFPWAAIHAQATVFATDLVSPVKLKVTSGDGLVVSEAGTGANDGRLSLVDRNGVVRPLIEGLPSGLGVTGNPSGPTDLLLRECCLIEIAIGEGDTLRLGDAGGEVPNPAGPSSPLFSSILRIRFSHPIDQLAGGFVLTRDDHDTLADGFRVRLKSPSNEIANVRLVIDFKDFRPDPITGVRGSQPFGMVRQPVHWQRLVADAAQNSIVMTQRRNPPQTLLRFDPVPNPLPFGPPVSDAVPTSIRHARGDRFFVTLFVGFPFAPGTSSVRVFDLGDRSEQELISGLTSPADVLPIGSDLYVLELTANLLEGAPGRLLRFDMPPGAPDVVASGLIGPTGMAHDESRRAIFVAENFTGRIMRVDL